jgi:hypothetical protein
MMADESDDVRDVVRYWNVLTGGYDCVFGTRFVPGGGVVDYPRLKLFLNRIANKFLQLSFRLEYNDITNAFKAYRKTTIDGCRPLLAPHFNLTVEIPLKAVVRGCTWKSLPITWRNRRARAARSSRSRKWAAAICLFVCTFGSKDICLEETIESPPRELLKSRFELRNKITSLVSQVLPLSEGAKAQEQIATRHTPYKIVLLVTEKAKR